MEEKTKQKKFSKDGLIIIGLVGIFAITQGYFLINLNQKVEEYMNSQVQVSNQTSLLYEKIDKAINEKDETEILSNYKELLNGNHFSLSLAGVALKNALLEKYRQEITGIASEKALTDNLLETMKKEYFQTLNNPLYGTKKELEEIKTRFQCNWGDLPCKMKSQSLIDKLNKNVLLLDKKNQANYYDLMHFQEYIAWQRMKFLKIKQQEPLVTPEEIYSPGQIKYGLTTETTEQ